MVDRVGKVVQQMIPVSDLDGLPCAQPSAY